MKCAGLERYGLVNGSVDLRACPGYRVLSYDAYLVRLEVEGTQKLLAAVDGNDRCADCGAADPDWASLNLGTLMCIEVRDRHASAGDSEPRMLWSQKQQT